MIDTITQLPVLQNLLELLQNGIFNRTMGFVVMLVAVLFAYDVLRKGAAATFNENMLRGLATTGALLVANVMLIPIIYIGVDVLDKTYDALGIPSVPQEFWSVMPFWLAGIFAIIAHDFMDYWNHRIMHQKWLWPIHATHHSDEEVNGFTSFRMHFMEVVFMKASYVFFLSWLGFSPEAAAFGGLLLLLHNVYVHADLNWDHGPFKYLIASPRFHRWHHANDERAFGKNLANAIPVWDKLFGTYFDPHPVRGKLGADGVPHADFIGLIAFPFVEWTKAIQKKFGRKTEADEQPLQPAE